MHVRTVKPIAGDWMKNHSAAAKKVPL